MFQKTIALCCVGLVLLFVAAQMSFAQTASIKNKMVQNGYLHAANFTNKKCAERVMQVYTK